MKSKLSKCINYFFGRFDGTFHKTKGTGYSIILKLEKQIEEEEMTQKINEVVHQISADKFHTVGKL